MIEPYKKKTLIKLKQAAGHLAKVMEMVEEDSYCADVIQQSLAVQGFLKSADHYMLESHLNTCAGKELSKGGKAKETMVNEILKVCGMAKR